MSKLFSEYKIKGLTLKNRIMMAPMCMYCAKMDGLVTDWHYIHYTTRAIGGVGLIVLEATSVEARGRISENDLGIWGDEHIEGLKRIVNGVHAMGAKVGIQLAHAGRKSETTGEAIIAPSPIRFSEIYREPVEMGQNEINEVIASFKAAAMRADQAGFDIIEIHGAHGYLINEFLSPLTNNRTDLYGGSIENRARFLKEVIAGVRCVWPINKPIILRISAEDYQINGNHPDVLGEIVKQVKKEGIDIVNVSSGGVVSVPPKAYPGYQVTMAEVIKEIAEIPVIAGGLITVPEMAEEILQNDRAEMIFLGRELLRNPYWPLSAAKKLRTELEWPVQYERSKR